MTFLIKNLAFFACCSLLFACGVKKKVNVDFETSEPLRVMVMPFIMQGKDGEIVDSSSEHIADSIPLLSEKIDEMPPELLRQMVQSELLKTNLDVLPPSLVDLELPHHGFGKENGDFDYAKIYRTSARKLCTHFLECDAVLYGWVTDWDRSYYGLQTVNSVGLKLRLVSARDNRVIYEIEVSNDEGRGVSGGPTGFSDLVLEPIKGLDSKYIEATARETAREAIEPLQSTGRPKFLSAPAPAVYAVAHNPSLITASKDESLLVLSYATAGNKMSFSIGEDLKDYPMFEVEPGKYVGKYFPVAGDKLSEQVVSVAVSDDLGRRTEQTSASGYINILP